MKLLITIFFLVFFLNLSSQNVEAIGKAIFESYTKKNSNCFNFFITPSYLKKVFTKNSSKSKNHINDKNFNWKRWALYLDIDTSITHERVFWRAFAAKMKQEEEQKWLKFVSKKRDCIHNETSNNRFEIIKVSENDDEKICLLLMNDTKNIGIKFSVVVEKSMVYLKFIWDTIFVKNEDKEFTCSISCNDEDKILKICDY